MTEAHIISKNNVANCNVNVSGDSGDGEGKSATFHDFLAYKGKVPENAPAACGGGRRTSPEFLPSAASDQGSDRPVSNHLEGIPYYGSRGDLAMPETGYIFSGSKRSNSDSFMAPLRDKFLLQGLADSQDNPVLAKLMRRSAGEGSRHPYEEASHISQQSHGSRTVTNNSKWDRSIPVNLGPVLQYPQHAGLAVPLEHQTPSSRIKDTNVSSSVVSQTAADEGSRTGIKGSGVFSSLNLTGGTAGRQPSGVLVRTCKQKSGVCISEPESSLPSQYRSESTGRQMTIFYGGQAHVFDNIHANKADVIMALAGSSGGSWSTACTPYSAARPSSGENRLPAGENDVGVLKETYGRRDMGASTLKEMYVKPSDRRDSYHGFGSESYKGRDRIKDITDNSIKKAKVSTGEKEE